MKTGNRHLAMLLVLIFCFLSASQGVIMAESSDNANGVYLLKKEQNYDSKGRRTLFYTYEYDRNGYLTKKTERHSDTSVSYWLEYENDAKGNKVKETRCDEKGAGIYRLFEYDENGNMIRETEYKKDGTQGAQWLNEYDVNGNMIKSSTVFSSGRLYSVDEYEYDDYGNEIRYILKDGSGTVSSAYSYEYELREDGRPVVKTSYDSNHVIYRIRKYDYDENGLLTTETVYDIDGQLIGHIEYFYMIPAV